jgi:hypothetical protein
MGRFFRHFLAFTCRGVATAQGCANINGGLTNQVQMFSYAIQRQFRILLNVIAKCFQGLNVKDLHPIRELAIQTLLN